MKSPPGHPGAPPRWTTSAKDGVGTATNPESRVWFTLAEGIVTEVYHPFIDHPMVRDCGFLVTDGRGFVSEEKRDAQHEIQPIEQGVAGYRLINTCRQRRYRLTKTVIADPARDVLLQRVQFEALEGAPGDYQLYVLLAPHIGNHGRDNDGWIGDFRGLPMLFARRHDTVLALGCSQPWSKRSCGYVGTSDGWQDLRQHGRMEWEYPEARAGNIALIGALEPGAGGGACTVALGFGRTPEEAGQQVRASLLCDFEERLEAYGKGWRAFQQECRDLPAGEMKNGFDLARVSTAVLGTHRSKRFAGGLIASLSIPWGAAHGDQDLGGYHIVWPRDLVETASALLAMGHRQAARETLFYLMCTQDADGHWPQSMWLDGRPYGKRAQSDETAFPILLADGLRRRGALGELAAWPMVRQAARFLVRTGPVSDEDRWEENAGYATFTLAAVIAALLAAADFADAAAAVDESRYLRETADAWEAQLDTWLFARDTALARKVGVTGYYVRMAPADLLQHPDLTECRIKIRNHPGGTEEFPAAEIVSVDALALVRFGVRAADDPRMLDTVRVIDAELRSETATGPVWHRYSHDGYGETKEGAAFRGTGIGRGWPLLAGERAHYELAAGHAAEAQRLLQVMSAQTSAGGMLPEQVWDAEDLPERGLRNGHPSGSAMPLAWAHAEYLKLLRSLADGRVFDLPPQPVQRYLTQRTTSPRVIWRFNHQVQTIPARTILRLETLAPARIRWSGDQWQHCADLPTCDSGLGVHFADLPANNLPPGAALLFTFHWLENDRWKGRNFAVQIAPGGRAEDH